MGKSVGGALQAAAVRTGQNPAGAIAATENMEQGNQRTLGGQEASAEQQRIGDQAKYGQEVLSASAQPASFEAQLAGQQGQLGNSALGQEEDAAKQPSFMDMLGQGVITAGETAAGAYCPAKGASFLLADRMLARVEDLSVGDKLLGMDGEPQNIVEIRTAQSPVVRVITRDGFISRVSPVHAFALPIGGFVTAAVSLGTKIAGWTGVTEVIDVKPAGESTVYNVITDGSHTYCADGLWGVGMGDGERAVSMQAWKDAGERLMAGKAGA